MHVSGIDDRKWAILNKYVFRLTDSQKASSHNGMYIPIPMGIFAAILYYGAYPTMFNKSSEQTFETIDELLVLVNSFCMVSLHGRLTQYLVVDRHYLYDRRSAEKVDLTEYIDSVALENLGADIRNLRDRLVNAPITVAT